MAKAPSMQFYPGDWQRDTGLKLCSLAARGLWAEMMWLMFDGEPFGHLSVKGSVIPPVKLAVIAGVEVPVVEDLLAELERYGVFSRTPEGIIYSRRMVRDAKRRETNALNGGKGGNPHLTGKKTRLSKSVNQKDNRQVIPLTADAVAEKNTSVKERAEITFPAWATPEFAVKWAVWKAYKAEKGKRYKPIGEQAALIKLAKEYTSEADCIEAIDFSMGQNYEGIYPPKKATTAANNGTRSQQLADALARQFNG